MEKRWSILVTVVFLAGCGSLPKPSMPSFELPVPKVSNPLTSLQADDAVSPTVPPAAEQAAQTTEVAQLKEQLIYGGSKARVTACNRLGKLAVSTGSKEYVDLLNNVWSNDPNHDVRMAAANGLSHIRNAATGGPDLADEGTRLSFLPKFWK